MDENQTIGLISGVGALVLVVSSLTARRLPGGQLLRHALLWAGIFAAGYVVFLFRADITQIWERARADITGAPLASASGTGIAVSMDADGHFWVTARTERDSARMLIDTGATSTVLSRATAERLGVRIDEGLPIIVGTANGNIRTQRGMIDRLWVGEVLVTDLPVLVSDADDINILGMNWLSRMAAWRVSGQRMEIEPRE